MTEGNDKQIGTWQIKKFRRGNSHKISEIKSNKN